MALCNLDEPAMTEPRLRYVQCLDARGLHRMAYWEWGDPRQTQVVVCAHGLTRQGRDFDALAADLSKTRRVVCPDVVGRGRSDWLTDASAYAVPTYVADMVNLFARLDAEQIDWVGTSMGGLIGMGVAALKGSPIRRLVLNDVGPRIELAALARIAAYVGQPGRWPSEQAAAEDLWAISTGFGPHTPEQWLALTRPLLKPDGAGGWTLRYDPGIGLPLKTISPQVASASEALLWHTFDSLRCATLLLRGAQSDLLSAETADEMTRRGPRPRLVVFEGVGHAPTLVDGGQRAAVCEFLLAP
jgi:pimeloyl-ACP methyl ester carboxylesterase